MQSIENTPCSICGFECDFFQPVNSVYENQFVLMFCSCVLLTQAMFWFYISALISFVIFTEIANLIWTLSRLGRVHPWAPLPSPPSLPPYPGRGTSEPKGWSTRSSTAWLPFFPVSSPSSGTSTHCFTLSSSADLHAPHLYTHHRFSSQWSIYQRCRVCNRLLLCACCIYDHCEGTLAEKLCSLIMPDV